MGGPNLFQEKVLLISAGNLAHEARHIGPGQAYRDIAAVAIDHITSCRRGGISSSSGVS